MRTIHIKPFIAVLAVFLLSCTLHAQETFSGAVQFDRTICDFGDVSLDDGPLSCTFQVKNISEKPIAIYNVFSSCGCTAVNWTREPLMPGKVGKISAKYTNDEGPYPFDKSLTVYMSGLKTPIVLKLRGTCHEKTLPVEEIYTIRMGAMGLKSTEYKCGNLQQGGSRSDFAKIANLSSSPMTVSFRNVSKGLTVSVSPDPVPAGSIAQLDFTIKADRGLWGKNWYYATPVINGVPGRPLSFWAFTKESFPEMTTAEKARAPRPMFTTSTWSFGKIRKGARVRAEYTFSNSGKEDLRIYKTDIDVKGASASPIPVVKPGQKVRFTVDLDTSSLPAGETAVIVTLTTNSPLRPIVNLFIVGWLDE